MASLFNRISQSIKELANAAKKLLFTEDSPGDFTHFIAPNANLEPIKEADYQRLRELRKENNRWIGDLLTSSGYENNLNSLSIFPFSLCDKEPKYWAQALIWTSVFYALIEPNTSNIKKAEERELDQGRMIAKARNMHIIYGAISKVDGLKIHFGRLQEVLHTIGRSKNWHENPESIEGVKQAMEKILALEIVKNAPDALKEKLETIGNDPAKFLKTLEPLKAEIPKIEPKTWVDTIQESLMGWTRRK